MVEVDGMNFMICDDFLEMGWVVLLVESLSLRIGCFAAGSDGLLWIFGA